MRITGGMYKGRIIFAPKGLSIRPATDRVRESIFAILTNYVNFQDLYVLDLFAGTGSLGFESLSRGAKFVTFVDNSRQAMRITQKTAQVLNCEEQCEFVIDDALSYISHSQNKFNLVFIDPPYVFKSLDKLPTAIFSSPVLSDESIVLIEHSKRTVFPPDNRYKLFREKVFGDTVVSFFIKKQSDST